MGSFPWENPPDFPDPDMFYEFTVNKLLNDEENLMNVVKLVEMEIPINTIADGLLMNAFMIGQISPQVAIISKDPIMELLMVIAQEAGITPVIQDPAMGRAEETQIDEAMARISNNGADATLDPKEVAPRKLDEVGEAPYAGGSGMMAPPSSSSAGMDGDLSADEEDDLMDYVDGEGAI